MTETKNIYLSVDGAAKELNTSQINILNWIKNGLTIPTPRPRLKLKATRIGKKLLVRMDDLQAFVESNQRLKRRQTPAAPIVKRRGRPATKADSALAKLFS